MDTGEAQRILSEHLARYRAMPYADLVARIEKVETFEVPRQGHRPWQVEVVFYWDGHPNGNVRVNALERSGDQRGHAALAINCVLAGAEWAPCLAAQLGR